MPVHTVKSGNKYNVVDKEGKMLKGGSHATKKAAQSHAAGANQGMGYWHGRNTAKAAKKKKH